MYVSGKSLARIAVVACLLAGCFTSAWADPVRITVDFSVTGEGTPRGVLSGSGSFSILTDTPAGGGQLENFKQGLNADAVSFSWAGMSWTRATADVPRLIFDMRGSLVYWELAGLPGGLTDISGTTAPDVYVDPFAFLYTIPGRGSHLFQGGLLSATVKMTPAPRVVDGPTPGPGPNPVPEPMPLALVGSGLIALRLGLGRPRHGA
jgi:hypothetical protein